MKNKHETQKLVYLGLSAELKNLLLKKTIEQNNIIEVNKFLESATKFDAKSQELDLVKITILKKLVIFFKITMIAFIFTTNIFFYKKKPSKDINFFYSLTKAQVLRSGSLENFFDFIISNKIGISENTTTIVEIKNLFVPKRFKSITLTFDIGLYCFRNYFTLASKLSIIRKIIVNYFIFIFNSLRFSWLSLIAKEFVIDQFVYENLGNIKKIKSVFVTCSSIPYQPLVFEYSYQNINKVMVWYSSNDLPNEVYRPPAPLFDFYRMYRHISTDEHWVWTNDQKEFFQRNHVFKKIVVKGSLMFYNAKGSFNSTVDIILFDITPKDHSLINFSPLYTNLEATRFIVEVIAACRGVEARLGNNISIGLKPKRVWRKGVHNSNYTAMVQELVENNRLKLFPAEFNIYDLISNARLVIGFPITSPLQIAKELGIRCTYYSSSGLLLNFEELNGIKFIQKQNELESFIFSVMKSKQLHKH